MLKTWVTEAGKLVNRIEDAKTERLLREAAGGQPCAVQARASLVFNGSCSLSA